MDGRAGAGPRPALLSTVLVLLAGMAALILAVESAGLTVMVAAADAVLALWLLAGFRSATASGMYRMTLVQRAAARQAGWSRGQDF